MPADGLVVIYIEWRSGGASVGFTVRMESGGIEEWVHEIWADAAELFASADLVITFDQDAVAWDREIAGE